MWMDGERPLKRFISSSIHPFIHLSIYLFHFPPIIVKSYASMKTVCFSLESELEFEVEFEFESESESDRISFGQQLISLPRSR